MLSSEEINSNGGFSSLTESNLSFLICSFFQLHSQNFDMDHLLAYAWKFFLQRKGTEEENGKGTEGEKTECKDWCVEWAWDGKTSFFVLRAPARCTKRVSI